MGDTKRKFLEKFKRPLPGLYSTVLQEFLVQSHLFRYNASYKYNEVRESKITACWSASCNSHSNAAACSAGKHVSNRPVSPLLLTARSFTDCAVSPTVMSDANLDVYVELLGLDVFLWHCSRGSPVMVQVTALGLVSIFDQVLEGLQEQDRVAVFAAYISVRVGAKKLAPLRPCHGQRGRFLVALALWRVTLPRPLLRWSARQIAVSFVMPVHHRAEC